MENASKALLIAAAIIIAIILISLGVYVVRQGQSAMGSINLSEQEVSAFNSKWESYEGIQMGSSAKALANAVNNYNRTASDRKITLTTDDYSAINGNKEFQDNPANNSVVSDIKSGEQYKVSFIYTKSGLISYIGISKQ